MAMCPRILRSVMRYARGIIFVAGMLLCGCTATDRIGYAVVYDGATAVLKPQATRGLVYYPWQDPNEVFYASCGFAEITYNETPIFRPLASYADESRRKATYLVMLGEWCRVKDYLFEETGRARHLVVFRQWRGRKYLVDDAIVYHDDGDAEYVADKAFIERIELTSAVRTISQCRENNGCFGAEDPTLEVMKGNSTLVKVGEDYCVGDGLYLQDLAKSVGTSR